MTPDMPAGQTAPACEFANCKPIGGVADNI